MAGDRALAWLESVVEERYGRGACVSIDRHVTELATGSHARIVVTIWNPKGVAIASTSCPTRREVIATALRALRGAA